MIFFPVRILSLAVCHNNPYMLRGIKQAADFPLCHSLRQHFRRCQILGTEKSQSLVRTGKGVNIRQKADSGHDRTVDVHIKRLREKLEGVSDQWSLKTVWGVGYKFEVKD